MKTVNIILGAIISFFLLLGIIFKTMHWPGAGVFIVLSASLLSLYMIPVAIGNIMSYEKKVLIGICNGIGAFAGMILSIGLLFKIMHWPGSEAMMMIGLLFTTIVLLSFVFLFIISKEPIKLSSGTFFSTICFGLLIYGVSIGGSNKYLSYTVTSYAKNIEKSVEFSSKELSFHALNTPIAMPLHQATRELYLHIENLKSVLIFNTSGISKEISDTISLSNINGLDNYDIPTHLLGISDPAFPVKISGLEELSAVTLKEKITKFNSILKNFDGEIDPIDVNDVNTNDHNESWETSTFYHMPLAHVILKLNQIELEAFSKSNYLITKKYYSSTVNQDTSTN